MLYKGKTCDKTWQIESTHGTCVELSVSAVQHNRKEKSFQTIFFIWIKTQYDSYADATVKKKSTQNIQYSRV